MRHRLSPRTRREEASSEGEGDRREESYAREKKIGILPGRRMIKLRVVRCYRNPDWDEPAAAVAERDAARCNVYVDTRFSSLE